MPPFDFNGYGNGVVVGRNGTEAEVQQIFLDGVDLGGIEAHRGQHQPAPCLGNADQDVAAAQVVNVIGEGAEGVQDGFRVPAFLEFEALPLDGFAVQEVVDVDGQGHGLFRQQDVDAEQVHGQHRVDDLETLAIHEGAEAFVGLDQALGLLLGDAANSALRTSRSLSSFSRKLARAWGVRSEVARASASRALASAWSRNSFCCGVPRQPQSSISSATIW
jgi:hypothetical protein